MGALFNLPELTEVEIIGSKVVPTNNLTVGLRSYIEAMPDKVDEFKQFLGVSLQNLYHLHRVSLTVKEKLR